MNKVRDFSERMPRYEDGEATIRLKWTLGQSSNSIQFIDIEDIPVL